MGAPSAPTPTSLPQPQRIFRVATRNTTDNPKRLRATIMGATIMGGKSVGLRQLVAVGSGFEPIDEDDGFIGGDVQCRVLKADSFPLGLSDFMLQDFERTG